MFNLIKTILNLINDYIMNTFILSLIIILTFIFLMTIVLNFVEKDRIKLMADFFEKVLANLFKYKK